ncbi:RE2 [Symbiodinium sp. CCMP2592]|nr:RE2 [Symbiodinium sp. CCMP2592]
MASFAKAMGVTGVEGTFRQCCEVTMEVFVADPLLEMYRKPVQTARDTIGDVEKNGMLNVGAIVPARSREKVNKAFYGTAKIVLVTIRRDRGAGLSVEGQVDELIKVENGDMNWIIPDKFLAFAGPSPTSTDADGSGCEANLVLEDHKLHKCLRLVEALNESLAGLQRMAQEVMSAQPLTATPVLEGEETGPRYGALQQEVRRADVPGQANEQARGDHPLMNGVDPPRMEAVHESPQFEAAPRMADQALDGDRLRREMETSGLAQPSGERTTEPGRPVLGTDVRPGDESDFASITASPSSPRRTRAYAGSTMDQPHQAERTVAMEYSYEAAEGMPGVRWVARLTERIGDLNFSPPEDLPPLPPQGQGALRSLEQGPEPLFTPEQGERLRRGPRNASLLFPTGGSSTSSDEIQAEVQRQLARYVQRYEGEARDLRGQVQQLQHERNRLLADRAAMQQNLPGGDRATMQQNLPGGDRAAMQRNLPGGDRAAMQQDLPGGDRATMQQNLPGGDRATMQQGLPGGDRATMQQNLPGGDRATMQQNLPGGDRATMQQNLPGGDRATMQQNLPGGDRATMQQNLPGGDRATMQQSLPGGDRPTMQQNLPGGDQAYDQSRQQEHVPGVASSSHTAQAGRGHEGSEEKDTTHLDLLGVIAQGMKQLQEAQVRALDRKSEGTDPETVKPGVAALPELKAPDPETSPVEVQDWLQLLQAPMADLSDSSYDWWTKVQALAQKGYEQWANATPLERLAMKAPVDKKLEEGKFARLNSRAASMLLASLDASVRADLVMRRSTQSSTQILYRVLTLYQPGGETEKRLVLDQLQSPTAQTDPFKAAKSLRDWERWFRRAGDVGVSTPDPSVLLRALSVIMQGVLEGNPEAAFRTSLVRTTLKLDTKPTHESVIAFHKHLLAEAEALASGSKRTPAATSTPDATRTPASEKGPKVRGIQAQGGGEQPAPKPKSAPATSSTTTSTQRPCKWFAKTEAGCKRGGDCQFSHEWGSVPKTGRCLICSSTSHMKKDCPTKEKPSPGGPRQRGEQQQSTSTATLGAPSARTMNAPAEQATSSTTTQPAAEPSPTSSSTGRRQPKESEGPEALKKVIEDASNMLKSMMASSGLPAAPTSSSAPTYESIQKQLDELKLRTMKVDGTKGGQASDDSGVLLDSGATHVLRPAHDQFEEENTKAVSVTLAGDEQRILKQAPSGSILLAAENKDRVQPIVPFGALIDVLGCTLKWTKGGFILIHPRHGRIRTRLRAGCPEMTDAGQAAEIIAELEMKKVEELKQRAEGLQQRLNAVRMMEVKQEDWRQNLAAYAQEGCVVDGLQVLFKSPIFKDLPEAVTGTMVPNVEEITQAPDEIEGVDLEYVRRKEGKSTGTNTEVVVVNVDVLLNGGWSMTGPAYKALMWGAMSSRVKAVLGAPPAGTFSVKRHEERPGYPGPVRSASEPYGLVDLNPTERYYVDKETTLVARQLMLYLVAHAKSGGHEVKFCMSHPENAEEIVNGKDAPSLWRTPMMKSFIEATEPLGMKKVSFDQGAFGYLSKSPVTIVSNLDFEFFDEMREAENVKERKQDERRPWATAVRRNVAEKLMDSGVASTRAWAHRDPGPDIRKMTAEQGWRLHVQRDHVPFRKDCEQCVMSLGTGRPHRRTKQKSAYVLSVDVGGPLRAVSRDAHGYGYRYFLAAAYTKPRFEDQDDPPDPLPEDLAAEDYDFRNLDLEAPELDEEPLDPEDQEGDPSVRKVRGDELWDDDEEADRQQRADQEQDELLEGNREIPMDHLYFVKPLKGKKAKQVMQAIQEIILELKHMNLPVVRIHSDRAHELRSPALREWTLGQQIMLTRTEGQSPQSNGTAERAVRYLKGQARLLLRTSGLPTSHWATAMVTAAHNQREKRLNPETFSPVCPYGTRVAIKKKRYSDGGKHDLMPHWVKGTYLGPVWDVRNGSAVLEDENGRIMVTTNVRPRLHDPGTAAEAEVREFEPPPRRRLRGKSAVDADGVAVRSLAGTQRASHRRRLVKEILEQIAKDPVHSVKRPQLVAETVPDPSSSYVTMGAFNHGGQYGVTKYTSEAPELTKKVTELLQLDFPDECFTSATLVKNTCMPTHRDVFNDKDSRNLVSPLQVTEGAGVWEELKPGDVFTGRYMEMLVNDKTTPGQVHSLTSPAKVNPKRWHCAVQGTEGARLLVVGHTIGSWRKLSNEMVETLEEAGFALPEEGNDHACVKAIQELNAQTLHYQFEVDEDDVIEDFDLVDGVVEVENDVLRVAKAAAENLYTPDVEGILSSCEAEQTELRVVHTVHPSEVERNLEKWVPSMMDEIKAMETMKAIKRVRGQEAKDFLNLPGAVVVPGKGVYTAKPPSKPDMMFRRKTRIVSCGNFQKKSDDEVNYSGGAAAEGVRLMVAEGSRRRWCIINGDVTSAFLRAPVPDGIHLAIKPPAVLVRAGLCQPDELWIALAAVYGFRSSPRWWGNYRTDMMKKAVTANNLRFEQGTADPNIWRVVDSSGELQGLIAVYVDDYLVTGPKEVCEDVHMWFSTTWQTTEIQFATKENAIRFLGMEIRSVENDNGDFMGFSLDQEGYVQELLRQYDIGEKQMSTIPSVKEWMSLDPATYPETFDGKDLKAAQSITGELAWLAQRCRPDLAYTVSVMGSMMSKDPARANQIGRKVLAYLNYTKEWKLLYSADGPREIVTYTDSSYAPDGDRSHGGAVVFWSGSPVAWRSGRQGLIATSSAETELLAASEGSTLTASVDALLNDMGAHVDGRELRVDNSAAIVLASEEGGSWRTRHLKVRAGALRQLVQQGWIAISYCPGDRQLADGLTKILAAKRMGWIMESWGLRRHREGDPPPEQPQDNHHGGEDLEAHSPLAVDSSLELYGVILMLVICVIALWEGSRHCYRKAEAARMRSLQAEQKLSKKEMRRLNQMTLTSLAEKAGVDLTKILTRESVRGAPAPAVRFEEDPPRPPSPPVAACAADEEFLRRRRRQRAEIPVRREPSIPTASEDRYDVPEPTRVAEEILRGRQGRTRDAEVQVELLKEMPRVVYTTPSGTCIHATRDCSTLNRSTKYIQKDVCAKCIPGQREVTERPR